MVSDSFDDIWQQPDSDDLGPLGLRQPASSVRTIDGIDPLDEQLGLASKLWIPKKLEDMLFGQVDGAEPSLRTYAVLDAARIDGLPERLDASGLEHR